MEKTKFNPATKGQKLDSFGNPAGTTYAENGVASHESFDGLKDLPATKAGEKDGDAPVPILYNEDGSIFSIPKDASKVTGEMKAEIAGLNIAINKADQKIATFEAMLTDKDTDEADKPIFEKNINSMKIARDSNKAKRDEVTAKLKEYELQLITPAQRSITRQLAEWAAKRDEAVAKIAELNVALKAFNVDINKPATASIAQPLATSEQKANYEALLAEHKTQGAAIVALVKKGMTNAEIANHLGINPANVPGPKNRWYRGSEGEAAGWKMNDEGRMVAPTATK